MTRIDDALTIHDGRLFIEECDAAELAQRFGTPLYVTSEDQLHRNLDRLRSAFGAAWPGEMHVLPSIKANASLAVRRLLSAQGAGCDAFGPAELEAALRGGVPPHQISLNGPTKDRELMQRAVGLGVRITLDSIDELERAAAIGRELGRPAVARLRLRPDYRTLQRTSELMPGDGAIHRAASRYKAGIPSEELLSLSRSQIQPRGIEIIGVMAHLGRHDAAPETWTGMAVAFVDAIGELLSAFPFLEVREIDLGGGIPTPRDPFGRAEQPPASGAIGPRVPAIEQYAAAIVPTIASGVQALGLEPPEIALEIEPGRSLFADAGIHLTTVRHIKRESHPFRRVWIETDTSDAWLADTILERNRWATMIANRADAPRVERVEIVGRTCAPDVIVTDEPFAVAEVGDVIAVLDTGAYQEASASNFNSLPRPATVLVRGADAEIIRRAETIENVFARDVIPPRLLDAAEMPDGVTGLDHVSVTTGDIERSLWFYRDLLGLRVRARGEEQGGDIADVTGIANAHVRWADLHLRHGQILELIQYLRPEGTVVRPATNDPGATHISLRVEDIDAVHERLVEAGIEVRSEPVALDGDDDWNGARCFYAVDPDGVTIELIHWASSRTPTVHGAQRSAA